MLCINMNATKYASSLRNWASICFGSSRDFVVTIILFFRRGYICNRIQGMSTDFYV